MNKKTVSVIFRILLILLIFATVAHAFYQSALPVKESAEVSDKVGEIIEEILPPEKPAGQFVQKNIRKLAHFTEFCMLGLASAGLIVAIGGRREWWLCGYGLLFCLIIAVCDEFIQGFVDRGSAVSDVFIDFCGATFVFLILILVARLIGLKKIKKA